MRMRKKGIERDSREKVILWISNFARLFLLLLFTFLELYNHFDKVSMSILIKHNDFKPFGFCLFGRVRIVLLVPNSLGKFFNLPIDNEYIAVNFLNIVDGHCDVVYTYNTYA